MNERSKPVAIARCACGSVELAASGAPIASVVCYCDTCREGGRRLEALPHAARIRDSDGGTAYVAYRVDRVRYVRGADRLERLKLSEDDATNRVFAACCHSPMLMTFDDARHWVSIYRARLGGDAPPVQFRICTNFRTADDALPNDVPSAGTYSFAFVLKLLTSRIAMLCGR